MDFYNNLKELRIEKGLLQRELAEKLNTSNSTICDWERGRSEPSINDLITLSQIFDCTTDFLIGNSPQNNISNYQSLTKEQNELLIIFNMLAKDKKREVIGFAKALAR